MRYCELCGSFVREGDFPHFEELEINLNESAIKEIKENMSNLINLHEEMRKVIKKGIRQ